MTRAAQKHMQHSLEAMWSRDECLNYLAEQRLHSNRTPGRRFRVHSPHGVSRLLTAEAATTTRGRYGGHVEEFTAEDIRQRAKKLDEG